MLGLCFKNRLGTLLSIARSHLSTCAILSDLGIHEAARDEAERAVLILRAGTNNLDTKSWRLHCSLPHNVVPRKDGEDDDDDDDGYSPRTSPRLVESLGQKVRTACRKTTTEMASTLTMALHNMAVQEEYLGGVSRVKGRRVCA